jgi:hypothetical protein
LVASVGSIVLGLWYVVRIIERVVICVVFCVIVSVVIMVVVLVSLAPDPGG